MFSSKSIPYAIMGAIAVAQGVSAVYQVMSFWKRKREKSQQKITDYHRVMDGGERRGWRFVLPRRYLVNDGSHTRHRIVPYGWSVEDPAFALDTAVLIRSVNPLPDGRKVIFLRRYSLLCPEVSATLSCIVFNPKEWAHQFTCYITNRSVASLFRHRETERLQLIVSDVTRRKAAKIFNLEPPAPESDIHLVYVDDKKRQLRIVIGRWTEQQPEDELSNQDPVSRFELSIVSYPLPGSGEQASNEGVAYQPISSETVSVVTGDKDVSLSSPISDRLMVVFLYNSDESARIGRHLCITLDPRGSWNVQKMCFWLQHANNEYDRFKTGAWSLVKLLDTFRALDPPEGSCRVIKMPLIEYATPVEMRPIGHGNFAITTDGLFRQWTSPPALKFLAAEKLFREKGPDLKAFSREELKKSIGFDLFDGIPEQSDEEEPAPVTHVGYSEAL